MGLQRFKTLHRSTEGSRCLPLYDFLRALSCNADSGNMCTKNRLKRLKWVWRRSGKHIQKGQNIQKNISTNFEGRRPRKESVPGHAMSATERYKNPTSGKEEGCLKRHNYSVQAILWPKKNTFPPALQDFIYFASTYIYTTLPLANNSE